MKNRRILCMTALMLAMLLAMGGCKQAETKEANAHAEQTVSYTHLDVYKRQIYIFLSPI